MPKSNPELAASMGKRMALRRQELNLTQEKVAEMAGITHQQYNKAERGKLCFGADTLYRVAQVLKVSTDYLLSGKGGNMGYQETLFLLGKMTDKQLLVVPKVLSCMLDFTESDGTQTPADLSASE